MAKRRQILVRSGLVIAAVSAGAGLLAASPEPPAEALRLALRAERVQRPVSAPQAGVRLELPVRHGLTPGGRNLFGTPAPPPPPPRVEYEAQPPPPPIAPPLPFTFVGTFESDGGETVYYLADAEKVHAVRRGQALNDSYRLESAAADRLELLYLPLAIKQTLVFSNPK